MSFRLARRKLRPLEWIQKCWMHFYCFLVKEITKWAEIFTGWLYYISLDYCKVWKHLQTLPIVCNGLNQALLYGLPQNKISRLQHIQNTAARVVNVSRKSCHITPILKELHWLPVSQRIVFKLMLIVYKCFNNIAPIYISELLKVYTPSRNLRSSNMSLLKEPTSKQTWGW